MFRPISGTRGIQWSISRVWHTRQQINTVMYMVSPMCAYAYVPCKLKVKEIFFFLSVCPSVTGEYSVKKVILGEPVTLYCDGKSTSDEFEITWKTPHQLVAQISKGHFSCGPGFENRVRFENVQSKGGFSLHLSPTVFSDTDMYSCFTGADLMKTWNLIVTGKPYFAMLCQGWSKTNMRRG